ncbi:MAG: nuclear transport factor 2 family protein [Betaproteobacteria bacterium]|nr:nuclear transport factor 2 family protein [Betaproteobacteria bacterium]
MSREALAALKAYWESFTRERVARLETVYAPLAYFRDPFNEVRGIDEIKRIFGHMVETLHEPRFTITETILEGDRAVLIWDFDFRVKAWKPEVVQRIHGLSVVRFDAEGRVAYHRDYWDAAGELYAKLPLVGSLMRYLARKMG